MRKGEDEISAAAFSETVALPLLTMRMSITSATASEIYLSSASSSMASSILAFKGEIDLDPFGECMSTRDPFIDDDVGLGLGGEG